MRLEDLEVYRLSEDMATKVYKITSQWPKHEIFGLTNQVRRAVVSVVLNIAEAQGKYHYKDRVKYLLQARGSIFEVYATSRLAKRLEYKDLDLEMEINNLQVKLNNFIKATQRQIKND